MNIIKNKIASFKKLFTNKGLVLCYHRVANVATDPWDLAVSPAHFEEQLQVLQHKFHVVPIQEFTSQLAAKSVRSKSVCITFDDGYSDNYFLAKPLLEKYQCPAAFFISSQYTGQKGLFWWEELTGLILETAVLPSKLSLPYNNMLFEFDMAEEAVITEKNRQLQQHWKRKDAPPTKRCLLLHKLWELMRPLPYAQSQEVLKQVRDWAGSPAATNAKIDVPMDQQQLKAVADHSLFTLGMHTVNHVALACHSFEVQEKEIAQNKQHLESFLDKPVTTITFPYGSFNATTIDIVKQQKITAAFTTKTRAVTSKTDKYQIGRFAVKNCNGGEFEKYLDTWLTKI